MPADPPRPRGPAGPSLPPVRRGASAAGGPGDSDDFADVLDQAAAADEPAGSSTPGADDADDLPDATVGTDDEFVAALDLPEVQSPRARRAAARRKSAADRRAAASSGAAAALLDRAREEAGFGSGEEDETGTLPAPVRRRKRDRTADATRGAAAGPNLNTIVLLTALAVPAVGFGLWRAAVGHESTEREWRQAFDELDDLMNEFTQVAAGPDPRWEAWVARFEEARPGIEYLVERAPRGTAGYDLGQAVTTVGNAVEMRSGGQTGPALRFLVDRAADRHVAAAVKLGFDRKMERPG